MQQKGSARIALIVSLGICALSAAMVLSSTAFGDTASGPRSRNNTCLPASVGPGVPSCLPGGSSSSASASKSSPSSATATTSPSGGTSFKSTITIGFKKGSFKGRVSSSSNKCVGGRNVVLFKLKNRRGVPSGHDTTDKSGNWKVKPASKHGKFYASVKQSKVSQGTCKAAKSKTIRH